ncbi:MAG: hypothetical protein KGS60_07105 [Verrucomicrobia bacterium]|nr:hypothetical protein [Verrucomicrobiota bacterium]
MNQKRVVNKKVAKKRAPSVGGRGPVGVPGKAAPEKIFFGAKPKPKQGASIGYAPPATETPGLGVVAVFLFLFSIALLAGVVVCFIPPDLSAVSGYPVVPGKTAPQNLLRRLDDAISGAYIDKKEATLTFTEQEINLYLNQRLKKIQSGPMAGALRMEGVYCDLQPDTINLYLVRTLGDKPLVISTSWVVEGDPEDQKFVCQTSSIGAIKVDGASLQPVVAPFKRFRETCARELAALQDVTVDRLRIDDGKLVVHVQP